jgi:chromosome segregation ATPase
MTPDDWASWDQKSATGSSPSSTTSQEQGELQSILQGINELKEELKAPADVESLIDKHEDLQASLSRQTSNASTASSGLSADLQKYQEGLDELEQELRKIAFEDNGTAALRLLRQDANQLSRDVHALGRKDDATADELAAATDAVLALQEGIERLSNDADRGERLQLQDDASKLEDMLRGVIFAHRGGVQSA